jgi:NADH:ubiquinone reductase (H+-translocating)
VPGVREHAESVKDIAAARGLSHAVHYASEGSIVAVVGGGMTGLEVASKIASAYPALKVKLVTRGETGGWLSARGRQYIRAALARQGVEVIEHVRVRQVEPERLLLADGAEVAARVIVWCGGFRASDLARCSGLDTDERGRVVVDRMLRSVSHPQIVAAGDSAATPPFVAGMPLRMCCQAAGPAAAHAADVVRAEIKGCDPKEFHFGYVHQPISLGRRDGLIQFVDRADRPKNSILTGRRAAIYKELITAGTIPSIKLERLLPGSTKWPFKEPKTKPQLESGATLRDHA